MSITYTYEIVKVDEAARCMEVVYSAEGYQTMHIGARLPFEGEALEDVIKAFSPVSLWSELSKSVSTPVVGQSGSITEIGATEQSDAPQTEAEMQELRNAQMWAQLGFEQQVASALVKFGVLSENPTSIPVAEL